MAGLDGTEAVGGDLRGLRLCLLGPHYPRVGGVSTQVELLTRYLRADGVDVRSVDTNVQALRRLGLVGRLLLPFAQLVVATARLWRASQGCDLIHAHLAAYWGFYLPLLVCLPVARLRRVPVVVTCHSGLAVHFVPRHRHWVRLLLRRVDAIITLSDFTGQIYRDLDLKTVNIPNVVDLERFAPAGAQARAAREHNGPRLLWVKYFTPVGNPEHMIRAFARVYAQLPQARLTMIGWGELLEGMRDLVRRLELPVELPGFVPFGSIDKAYRQADIFVYTSLADNQPNALLEASACGLPIVSTATGGIPYVIQDGVNGILVPPDDEAAFAKAIVRLASDPLLAARIGQAAVENAQRYAWPAVRGRLNAQYAATLRSREP